MIALVTDSGSQITSELRARIGVRVVPLTVVVDGEPLLEGVDLDTEKFYRRLEAGATVSTAAPSPGSVLEQYQAAADGGATQVLSVHTGANLSGTVNSVKVAAEMSPVPVEIVDTRQASFSVACCVWAASDALAVGADLETAAGIARQVAASVGNVFVIGGTDLARGGGRVDVDAEVTAFTTVVALELDDVRTIAQVNSTEEAVAAMAEYVEQYASDRPLRIGVGDAVVPDVARALADRLLAQPTTAELVRYEVGPSVGAHSGPGTVGAVFYTL